VSWDCVSEWTARRNARGAHTPRGRQPGERVRRPAAATISLPQAARRELDKVAREEGISRSDVIRQSLEEFLFARRFRQLRQRMMAAAQAQGIFTDEDVFNRVS
jgi:predicted transcriptional regulator